MSKPWGVVGAWALEAERAEAEERERADGASGSLSGGSTLLAGQPSQSFPSLKEAVTKPKKKKGVSLTLSEFTTGNYVGPGGARREPSFESKGLTHDEMIRLPTGPRERTAEELEHSRLGGGFRSYGYGGSGGGVPPRRRSEFGMDDEPRRGASISRATDPDLPSRADEVDNWATSKKFTPSMDSGRQERYGSLASGGSSKADDVDNWSLGKKSSAPPPSRNSGFGSGFRDSPVPGADSDRWVRGGKGSFSSNGERERPRLILDPPKRDSGSQSESVRSRPSPFGAARPREEVLAEKGMDWRKMETEIEDKKSARPTSSHSSRPSSAQSSRPGSPISQISGEGGAAKSRPKVNPFGDAKPREVLLEEKGMDWRKIDLELEHRSVERPLTDEEKMLKEEIDHLKKQLAYETDNKVNSDSAPISTEQVRSLHELIREKEKELDQLVSLLDDKVRFGQKASTDGRPGSGSGRTAFSADRAPSQSTISDDSRNIEFMDRPRSRGRSDSWSRPMDDRRGFSRSRDSGFLASRNVDRPISRERW
ncbi:eukaryotic translation initiation factor 4B1-like [Phalaenopsis equestris]|uniref:eukaryotic translation initiation factor 4B1-like n=1 Tax=Phalaenopsis equestris TaxID=78828 RepID=UPI0009E2E794|nr:eukaryotic translation initiation factor 4B1-like [Phalaenopsis equestris]